MFIRDIRVISLTLNVRYSLNLLNINLTLTPPMFVLQQYSSSADQAAPNLISVINLTDLATKRIIRMAKKITSFTTMCQADQIALLKGGCTELMILRSVLNYDPDKNSWRVSCYR